jgi:hypothetical protein
MRFRERGQDPGALDAATSAWTVLLDGSARDAPIHARLAHAAWIRGRASAADPSSARVYFELAEERGWACAMATPGFAVRMRRAAGRPSAEALAGVDPVDAPCLAWAAAGMVEVLALRGPGASLDLATLDALRGYLHAHPAAPAAPWEPEGLPGFDDWLDARRALLADDALARQAARGDFDRAVAAAPDFLLTSVPKLLSKPSIEGPWMQTSFGYPQLQTIMEQTKKQFLKLSDALLPRGGREAAAKMVPRLRTC